MGPPGGSALPPKPRAARCRTELPCASFAMNIGPARCRGQPSAALAKSCSRWRAHRAPARGRPDRGPAPSSRRRRVDAPGNAGLYSARMYRVYGALLALAWAAVLPCQMLMSFLQRGRLPPFRERLGFLPGDVPTGGFWIHAVSVGEMRLALRILPELRRRFTGTPVHVSTGTPTGRALGAAPAGGPPPESIGALPFDLPFAMGRLLDRLRPRAVLIVETEIWPNLLRLCAKRGVPVLLVNGRISSRSFPRYRALRGFVGRALPRFRTLGVQSRDDADRVISLGAPADRVVVTGNVKFDLDPPRVDPVGLRRRLGVEETAPLFVAGSTAAGEEAPVLQAFRALRAAHPRARLVLAPRHPENFGAAERTARDAGHAVLAWSRLAERTADSP